MGFLRKISNGKTQCLLCPRECVILEGQRGFCHVRKNVNDDIVSTTYGYTTGLAIDPIEKKPLYHFYPSSKTLSFGTLGCNMGCLFCQNFSTTKSTDDELNLMKIPPEIIVKTALKYFCKSIAFTYNDPIVFYEYAIDTARLAHENGIKTVAVTAGYINEAPAKEFFAYMDAVNIDLKGFTQEFYRKNCLADFEKILDTIKYVANETDCHLELTTLLIEGENTDENQLLQEFRWILENLGDNVPLHLSAFHPAWKMLDKSPTSVETLLWAYQLAKNLGLKYVYTGNISDIETSTTFCHNCGAELISRDGFKVISNNMLAGGKCPECFTKQYGCF